MAYVGIFIIGVTTVIFAACAYLPIGGPRGGDR